MYLAYIKKKIRVFFSFMNNPILFLVFLKQGVKKIIIGKRTQINSFKYFNISNNLSIGNDCRFTFIEEFGGCHYNPLLIIKENVSMCNRCSILCADTVQIGKDTLIASDVLITSENHGVDLSLKASYRDQPLIVKGVQIGDNCWIGEKVTILPGVSLGDNTIVGAHSVVTKSFPKNSMIAGIPAVMIKRYDERREEWIKIKR
ncbi:DapH/DapD/GlmU-related protein [Streptococcus massiliensis]|uniref:CpsI n=1 Tax=Streptococcus massiliensis TaxID=313439 RepID=A0A380L1H5_9STRE|nr:DapH/DapD/GlmU-related protein [Streptococcus massiliensis]SUN76470.1 CpsI [Streptococcus massiliensis]